MQRENSHDDALKEGANYFEKMFGKLEAAKLRRLISIAEQTENYNDMLDFVRLLIKNPPEAWTYEDYQLIDTAFRIKAANLRAEIRGLLFIEQDKSLISSDPESAVLKQYRSDIYNELDSLCKEFLLFCDGVLCQHVDHLEAYGMNSKEMKKNFLNAFHKEALPYKMRADFLRYQLELLNENPRKNELKKIAKKAYLAAREVISNYEEYEKTIRPESTKGELGDLFLDPLRLSIILNAAVFNYDNSKRPFKYIEELQSIVRNSMSEIGKLDDKRAKEVCALIQLIRDNLAMWSSADKNIISGPEGRQQNQSFEGPSESKKGSKTNIPS